MRMQSYVLRLANTFFFPFRYFNLYFIFLYISFYIQQFINLKFYLLSITTSDCCKSNLSVDVCWLHHPLDQLYFYIIRNSYVIKSSLAILRVPNPFDCIFQWKSFPFQCMLTSRGCIVPINLDKTSPASMGSTFNPQILVDKLTKLNISQTSIESIL